MKNNIIAIYEQLNVKKFLSRLDKYDFKDGDYTDICKIFYGPNLEIRIQAGFDFYTVNEDGTICNNKETDKRHYYLEAMVYVDMHGEESDECICISWYDEVAEAITEDVAKEIWDEVYNSAIKYIDEEAKKLPKVWLVSFSEETGTESKTTIFSKYEKAKEYFDACVKAEKNNEDSVAFEVSRATEAEREEWRYNLSDKEKYFEAADDCGRWVVWKITEKEIY